MDALDELSEVERGALLAALLDGREDAAGPLSHLAGQACLAPHSALRHASTARRRRTAAELSRTLFSTVPAGVDRIHPSWIDDLLARQSPAVARLVLEALPATTTARLAVAPVSSCGDLPDWVRPLLVRMVLGQLAPMPAGEATSAQAPAQLALLRSERLHDVLTRLGLLALALLVRKAAGPDIVEQVTRALPGPLRRRFQVALSLEIPALPHPPQSLPLTGGADTERRLVALACGLLAPRLTRRLRRQVAQRLPRELGLPLWQATVAPRSTPGESLQLLSLADRLALEDGT